MTATIIRIATACGRRLSAWRAQKTSAKEQSWEAAPNCRMTQAFLMQA
jgi:hypothetical protein